MDKILKEIIEKRKQKNKKLSESIAKLEESLFVAIKNGNGKKEKSIRIILKRLRGGKFP